jgi:hypothetical protein
MKKNSFLKINKFPFKEGKNLLIKLKKNKIVVSPWIEEYLLRQIFFSNTHEVCPCKLYKIHLKKDLGVKKEIFLKDVYKLIKKNGYQLIRPEIALYSRIFIKQKKLGTWIRFATPLNSMIDSDGIPHLPKIGYALNRYFLETYWAYPRAVFHPHNYFIVCKKI